MTQTIVYYLIALNIVTFFVYGIDKWKAKRAKWRIREAALLGLAVLGGSIGALLVHHLRQGKQQGFCHRHGGGLFSRVGRGDLCLQPLRQT